MKTVLLPLVMLFFSAFGQAQSPNPPKSSRPVCSAPMYFDSVPGAPKEAFLDILSKLKSEAADWDKTWRISVPTEDRNFLIDKEMSDLIDDTRIAITDMNNSIAEMEKSLRVSEAMAITFDLARIHENLAKMSGFIVITGGAQDEFVEKIASVRFRENTSYFRTLVSSTIMGVGQYQTGLQSYVYALGLTIDSSLPK